MVNAIDRYPEWADEQLRQSVLTLLARRNVPALRHLEVEARNGVVTLRGRVSCFYEKQISHHVVRHTDGVSELVDLVDVRAIDRAPPARPRRGWHLRFAK